MQEQVEGLLHPVVQAYRDRQTQLRMDAFVTMTHRFAKIRSKRLQAAVSAISGAPIAPELALTASEAVVRKRKRAEPAAAVKARSPRSKTSATAAVKRASNVADAPRRGQRRRKVASNSAVEAESSEGEGAEEAADVDSDGLLTGPAVEPEDDGGEAVNDSMSRFIY